MREAHSYVYSNFNTADTNTNCDLNCNGTADAIADAVRAISYTLTYAYFNVAAASYSHAATSPEPSATTVGSLREEETQCSIRLV
jgi:hypothetical protein